MADYIERNSIGQCSPFASPEYINGWNAAAKAVRDAPAAPVVPADIADILRRELSVAYELLSQARSDKETWMREFSIAAMEVKRLENHPWENLWEWVVRKLETARLQPKRRKRTK